MRRLFAVAAVFMSIGLLLGFYLRGTSRVVFARDGGSGAGQLQQKCSAKNGDVNGDGSVDLSDAVTILGNLFLGNPTELVPLCATQRFPSLPTTGQEKCYNGAGEELNCNSIRPVPCLGGQDGFYQAGCPSAGRFVDNGDGTVMDNCTGLMWQRDTADVNGDGQVVNDKSDAPLWCDAIAYCDNLSFAGHEDWRLPNVRELQSIVDYGRVNPSIDPVFGALSDFYWSSTSSAGVPDHAWFVDFGGAFGGGGGVGFKDKVAFLRAVRGP